VKPFSFSLNSLTCSDTLSLTPLLITTLVLPFLRTMALSSIQTSQSLVSLGFLTLLFLKTARQSETTFFSFALSLLYHFNPYPFFFESLDF